jgi:hypothetical protein
MNFRIITLLLMAVFPAFALSAEELNFTYLYEGGHRVDFSKMSRGPLRIAEFTDSRDVVSPQLLTDKPLGTGSASDGYQLDKPLADLVQDAITQSLLKGNAGLVESGEKLRLDGRVLALDAQLVSTDGVESIQLTLRTEVKLQGPGRTIWQTVLFGRGTAAVEAGLAMALTQALDRTIQGLVQDDYFLNEVL